MVARAFAPLLPSLATDPRSGAARYSVVSDLPHAVTGTLTWQVVRCDQGDVLRSGTVPVHCAGPGCQVLVTLDCSDLRRALGDARLLLLGEIRWEQGALSRHYALFARPCDLRLQPPHLQVAVDPSGLI
jgi:hypothetical protein